MEGSMSWIAIAPTYQVTNSPCQVPLCPIGFPQERIVTTNTGNIGIVIFNPLNEYTTHKGNRNEPLAQNSIIASHCT